MPGLEYQDIPWGKGVRVTTLPPSCAECLHINLCNYFLKPLIIDALLHRLIIDVITNYIDKLLILSVYIKYITLRNYTASVDEGDPPPTENDI